MDPITHTLTGVLLAETGFRQRMGPVATAALAVAAEAPDVDVVLRLLDHTQTSFRVRVRLNGDGQVLKSGWAG